jgi:excisionase family DNA binding protein
MPGEAMTPLPPDPPRPEPLWRIPEVARLTRLSIRTIERMIERGELVTVHIGRSVRVPQSEVVKLTRQRDEPLPPYGPDGDDPDTMRDETDER